MEIDEHFGRFRVASRELFNHFFRVSDPYKNDGWALEERFSQVEAVLFEKLVSEQARIPPIKYGSPHPSVRVLLRHGEFAPIMLNREVNSGYWDFPHREVTTDATLTFIRFFDWDLLAFRDNQYVLVRVDHWPAHPEVVGKQGLLESQYARFVKV